MIILYIEWSCLVLRRRVLILRLLKLHKLSREDIKAWGDDALAWVADVVYDRKQGGWVCVLAAFLWVLSYVFEGVVRLRTALYDARIFRDQPLGCLVVVVGNLTVGGTGKTPIVEKFARSLTQRGRKVAILSRGYMSRSEPLFFRAWRWLTHVDPEPPKIVSDGQQVFLNSEDAGDEPYMLAQNLPGVIVLVDKNRVKAGRYAVQKFGVDTLILDDGYQYLPLRGRLNLLLVDKTNPFGNKRLLPRGILREPLSHLKRASYIFITKSDGLEDRELEATLRRHHPNIDLIECTHKPQFLMRVGVVDRVELSALQGKKVAALSGIASPESFERFLVQQGALLAHTARFLDHHRFTAYELASFYEAALKAGAEWVLTTEKDAVRLTQQATAAIPTYFLRMEIDILSGDKDFAKAVDRICFPKLAPRGSTRSFI